MTVQHMAAHAAACAPAHPIKTKLGRGASSFRDMLQECTGVTRQEAAAVQVGGRGHRGARGDMKRDSKTTHSTLSQIRHITPRRTNPCDHDLRDANRP